MKLNNIDEVETVESTIKVTFFEKILPPWQHDVTTSPLYFWESVRKETLAW